MSTISLDCRGRRMMERYIAELQTIYSHVEFMSYNGKILTVAVLAWKSVASTIIVVCGYGTITKKYRYESKKHYLFKYDNCAWIYSDSSSIFNASKYEYYRDSAWNILWRYAWNILEQYDNWQVVFPRAVAIHTPLGEFHPPWSVRDLESTIIVLGVFQPKNCSFNLGSTII